MGGENSQAATAMSLLLHFLCVHLVPIPYASFITCNFYIYLSVLTTTIYKGKKVAGYACCQGKTPTPPGEAGMAVFFLRLGLNSTYHCQSFI